MTPGRLGAVTLTAIVVYGIVYWLKLFLRMRTDSGLLSIPEKSFFDCFRAAFAENHMSLHRNRDYH